MPYRLPVSFGTNYRLHAGSAAMSGGILGLEAAEPDDKPLLPDDAGLPALA